MLTQTFLRILPLMWHRRLMPSIQVASSRPLPSIRRTCAYSVTHKVQLAQSRPSCCYHMWPENALMLPALEAVFSAYLGRPP